jgi:hypothetical protein
LQESDEKWDQARSLTAQAQEQSRIAQTKAVAASATERESNEAMRRADVARGNIQDLEVSQDTALPSLYCLASCHHTTTHRCSKRYQLSISCLPISGTLRASAPYELLSVHACGESIDVA